MIANKPKKQRAPRKLKKMYVPYIRRGNGDEQCHGFIQIVQIALLQANFEMQGKKYYVMVQRVKGRNTVMTFASSKAGIKNKIISIGSGRMTYKQWLKAIKPRVNKLYPAK